MLRAALIGFGSSGKTTLFQLMTSVAGNRRARRTARASVDRHFESARRAARSPDGDVQPEEAGAGDGRVLRPGAPPGRPAARRRSSTSSPTRTPTRSSTCCARFDDPAVPHPSGSVDPARDAQAMEDELILADLGVAERRLERLEKDLKKSRTAELERERDVLDALPGGARRRTAAARARSEGRRSQAAARLSVPLGEAAADRHQPRRSRSSPAAATARRASTAPPTPPGLTPFLSRAGDGGRRRLREDRARDRAARSGRRRGVSRRSRPDGIGARPRDSRQLRSARLHFVLHGRRGRVPRLVDSARHAGAARGRRDSQRHRARLHPRRGRQLRSR